MVNSPQTFRVSPEMKKVALAIAAVYTVYELASLLGKFGTASQEASLYRVAGVMANTIS